MVVHSPTDKNTIEKVSVKKKIKKRRKIKIMVGDLHKAAEKGDLKRVKYLIKHGAKVNAKNKKDHCQTALHKAAGKGHLRIVKYLISKGAIVDIKGMYGVTPLRNSVARGKLSVVKYLVRKGANAKSEGLLDVALRFGHSKVANYLKIKGARKSTGGGAISSWASGPEGCD